MPLMVHSYPSQFPHGLMFHRFHDRGSPPCGQGSLAPIEFEKILHFVGIENILSPEEWLFKLKNNKLQNNDFCVTFDDGLKCQYDICLPLLEKYGLKGFWFIYSSVCEGGIVKSEVCNYIGTKYFRNIDDFFELFFSKCDENILKKLNENRFRKYRQEMRLLFPFYSINDLKFRFIRNEILPKEEFESIVDNIVNEAGVRITEITKNLWLSNSELKSLKQKGHFIGLHSYDHPFGLSKLSYREQYNQYMKNYAHIKRICHRDVVSMSHPFNSYNKDTLKILRQLGILCGFRSNMTSPHGRKINPSCLEIAREDATDILKVMPQINI